MTHQLQFQFGRELLPEYSIRVSNRARRARIDVSPFGEVQVVIPSRFNKKRVPQFIFEHYGWLRRVLDQIDQRRQEKPELYLAKPREISLHSLGKSWRVTYRSNQHQRVKETGLDSEPLLIVREEDYGHHLQEWLHEKARETLVPWLNRKSVELSLNFRNAQIRSQKTRWGSCSSRGIISLNRNLLFLPKYLVGYLFVHELCHTAHLNHSKKYWHFVGNFEPNFDQFERELQIAYQHVPLWAYPD